MTSYEGSETENESLFEEYIFSGKMLNDRYILISQIGEGTFARVWSCFDIRSKNFNAIKIQHIEEHECALDELQYYNTINKSGNVNNSHKYISTMIDYFTMEGNEGLHDCFVFNLAACSTYDIIRYIKYNKEDKPSPLSLKSIKQIIYQILLAIKSINENYNLLHTDIRAENILIMGTNKKMELFKQLFDYNHIEKSVTSRRKKMFKKFKKKKIPQDVETKMYEEVCTQYFQKILSDEKFDKFNEKFDKFNEEFNGSHTRSNISSDSTNYSECDEHECSDNHKKKKYDEYDSFSDLDDFINDEKSEEEIFDKNVANLLIDLKYLNNICIKLTDFGSACFEDKKYSTIQARHYRAPEVIIGHDFNTSCDIWSVGCLLFELLTGEVLFRPNKTPFTSRNKYHLYKMYKLLGPIPNHMINRSKHHKLFFNRDGTLKINKKIKFKCIKEEIIDEIKLHRVKLEINDDELNEVADFLRYTFEYDPEKRPNATILINHKWFSNIDK